jgi:hypothetical protein
MNVQTRKIGLNKGKRRIWLEGAILTDNGIKHGMRFNPVPVSNGLLIRIEDNGKRKIAGKPDRPIIDMTGATVTSAFDDGTKVVEVYAHPFGLLLKSQP